MSRVQKVINLASQVDQFDEDTFRKVIATKDTILSVAMLSFIRPNKLRKMLNHWNENRIIKSSMAIRVQGAETLSKKGKKKILTAFNQDKFSEFSTILFNEGNRGTGVPRKEMVHTALKFNTPYIMTTDDDMLFPFGSIEVMISLLMTMPELGAIDIWVNPNLNAWYIDEPSGQLWHTQPNFPLCYCDAMGSATMIMRREVFDTCDLDEKYYVGWGDLDFCMQMRKAGWKLAILAIPGWKALNDVSDNPVDYTQIRYNKTHNIKSKERFLKKWNLRIT